LSDDRNATSMEVVEVDKWEIPSEWESNWFRRQRMPISPLILILIVDHFVQLYFEFIPLAHLEDLEKRPSDRSRKGENQSLKEGEGKRNGTRIDRSIDRSTGTARTQLKKYSTLCVCLQA